MVAFGAFPFEAYRPMGASRTDNCLIIKCNTCNEGKAQGTMKVQEENLISLVDWETASLRNV